MAFEIGKGNFMMFDEAACVALRVKEVINGRRRTTLVPMSNKPTPMEIGNVETRKDRDKKKLTDDGYALVRKKACFICKKKSCRLWKHSNKKVIGNAIDANLNKDLSEKSSSESDN